jgi:hypothetical protein
VRFVVLSFGSPLPSGVSLARPETATLVVDSAVHPSGFDGGLSELSAFAVIDAASLDEVLDVLPPVGTFEVRPTEVT